MNRSLSLLALTAAITVFTQQAEAAQSQACCRGMPKWYAGVGGGVVFLDDADVNVTAPSSLGNLDMDYGTGFGFNGQFGYRISSYFRVEAEASFRTAELDHVNNLDPAAVLTDAGTESINHKTVALMANAYFDLNNPYYITPYIGAGLGMAYMDNDFGITLLSTDEKKQMKGWAPAYQLMGGLSYGPGAYDPNWPLEFYFQYRYFKTAEAEVDYTTSPTYVRKFKAGSQNFEVGVRYYVF